jgi:hypothetical protein
LDCGCPAAINSLPASHNFSALFHRAFSSSSNAYVDILFYYIYIYLFGFHFKRFGLFLQGEGKKTQKR